MLRIFVVVAAVLVASGCAKKVVRSNEPELGDSSGLTQAQKDDLASILKNSVLSFEFDDATLSPMSRGRLEYLAEALMKRPWATIRIAGHCDERGTVEYNLALGYKRARAAADYLTRLGVAPTAIEVLSFGAEVPVDESGTEDAFALNRRDEIVASHDPVLGSN